MPLPAQLGDDAHDVGLRVPRGERVEQPQALGGEQFDELGAVHPATLAPRDRACRAPSRLLALTLHECQIAPRLGFSTLAVRVLTSLRSRKRSTVSVSIKPLEDRIVIKQVEAEQTTASGLVIPDTAKEKPQEGEVVAVGPGRIDDNGNRVPLDVAVGDKVIYSKYGGTEVKFGGEELLVLSARDVLAVVVR